VIGRLRGQLLSIDDMTAVIDVGGVGYEVELTTAARAALVRVGDAVDLYTHLNVREDAHYLFGFHDALERDLFRLLINVSNVGPRLAMTVFSGIAPEDLTQCVREGDVGRLTKLPGIGRKTAERLVMELKDRVDKLGVVQRAASSAPRRLAVPRVVEEAESALVQLGYRPVEASRAVNGVFVEGLSTEDVVRQALRRMVVPET
jgi:Holliday junction DNA helicase RuvA